MGCGDSSWGANSAIEHAQADFTHVDNANALQDAVATARDHLSTGDYSRYLAAMQGASSKDCQSYGAVTSADHDTSSTIDELRVLDFGNEQLYQALDTYSNHHGGGNDKGDPGDGKIGKDDLTAFINDLHADGATDAKGWAMQWDAQNPNHKLEDVLNDMQDDLNADPTLDKSAILKRLGVESSDGIEQAYKLGQDAAGKLPSSDSSADTAEQVNGTLGDLPVHGKEGHQGLYDTFYTVQDGDNLTSIARRALGVKDGQPDPCDLQDVIRVIASSNNYSDQDVIYAGDEMKIDKFMLHGGQPPEDERNVAYTASARQDLIGD
ncbi:MAG TPA: LysM domain-containing protein, partial [Chroococcales cyanobacterium]